MRVARPRPREQTRAATRSVGRTRSAPDRKGGCSMPTRRALVLGAGAIGAATAAGLPGADAVAAGEARTPVSFDVPQGACDCHVHVFPDPARFPFWDGRAYTPPVATADDLLALQRALRLDRVVIVQPSVYGTDNRATLDGMRQLGPQRARG